MNLQLQDPTTFLNAYPEYIEDKIELNRILGRTVKFSPKGTLLAVGCTDGRILIFDFYTRTKTREFAANSQHFLPISKKKGIEQFRHQDNLNKPQYNTEQNFADGHRAMIMTIAWFRNATKIATGANDCCVKIWDVVTGKVEKTFEFCSMIYHIEMNSKNKYEENNFYTQ